MECLEHGKVFTATCIQCILVGTNNNLQEELSHLLAENERLRKVLSEEEESGAQVTAKYFELLMAVGNKYQLESRHETALRYIKQAEEPAKEAKQALEGEKP